MSNRVSARLDRNEARKPQLHIAPSVIRKTSVLWREQVRGT